LKDYLYNGNQVVCVDNVLSASSKMNTAAPQDSVLESTLFQIFINDLLERTTKPDDSFTDDSTLHARFSAAPLKTTRQQLTNSINVVLTKIAAWG
jgi:hypothetical protein